MRTLVLVLAVVLLAATLAGADSGSISRDARGPQPTGDYAPLGSPPSPASMSSSQSTIFAIGLTLLIVAAALGVYTFVLTRGARRPTA